MKTFFNAKGCLTIQAENGTDDYALRQWCKSVEYSSFDKVEVNMGSINIIDNDGFGILDEECDK